MICIVVLSARLRGCVCDPGALLPNLGRKKPTCYMAPTCIEIQARTPKLASARFLKHVTRGHAPRQACCSRPTDGTQAKLNDQAWDETVFQERGCDLELELISSPVRVDSPFLPTESPQPAHKPRKHAKEGPTLPPQAGNPSKRSKLNCQTIFLRIPTIFSLF